MNIRKLIISQGIIEATCEEFGIPEQELKRRTRVHRILIARQAAAHVMKEEGISNNWIALFLGIGRTQALRQARLAGIVSEVDQEYREKVMRIREYAKSRNTVSIQTINISIKK